MKEGLTIESIKERSKAGGGKLLKEMMNASKGESVCAMDQK